MPKITIIITAYKDRGWIEECVLSALDQTFTDYDIIFASDGNHDLVHYTIPAGIPFYCFPKSNYANLVNEAVKVARGEWIKVLHDDDILTHRCLEYLWNYTEGNDLVYGNALCFNNTDKSSARIYYSPANVSLKTLLPITTSPVNFEAILFRKEAFLNIGGFDTNLGYSEDYDLLIQMLRYGYKFRYCPYNVVWYRHHERQITGNEPEMRKNEVSYLQSKHMDLITSNITWK